MFVVGVALANFQNWLSARISKITHFHIGKTYFSYRLKTCTLGSSMVELKYEFGRKSWVDIKKLSNPVGSGKYKAQEVTGTLQKAKIFGIGLPKTGTNSLQAALEILGYSNVHIPISRAEIDSHDVAHGISVACRFEELDKLYPGSKFILTVRDLNQWLASCEYHFCEKVKPDELSPKFREFLLSQRVKAFGTASYDREIFKQAYLTQIDRVENYFVRRPQDLLILNIGAGEEWEKLCSLLGDTIPDRPFPHKNIAGEFITTMFKERTAKIEQNILADLFN